MRQVFPLRDWTKVEALTVKTYMQDRFEQWGLPQAIRFDNGKPWANPTHGVPTALALWLVGLGVKVVFGRPRRSTDNAVVERSHGILECWVEPEKRLDLPDLQATLDDFVHIQRAIYPSCDGQSRFATYPDIDCPRQVYQREQEASVWQLQRVLAYVATFRFTRTVEKNGRITHFTREYALGRQHQAQQVTVFLDADTCEWVVENRQGEIVKRFLAEQLTYLTLSNMQMVYRMGTS